MTKHGVHKNKPDKPKASKGPAESEVSPTEKVGATMDELTSAQADGVIAQKLCAKCPTSQGIRRGLLHRRIYVW